MTKCTFPTLFDDGSYLIFRDKDVVTLVDHGRGISSMFPCEEWHEFARAIVSAANKDCENKQEAHIPANIRSALKDMILESVCPLLDRIHKLERGLCEPIVNQEETASQDDIANEMLDMLEEIAAYKVIGGSTMFDGPLGVRIEAVIKKARGVKECEDIDEDSNEEPE